MSRDGYDPRELSDVMAMLGRVSGGEGERVPGWLSTHPDPENREEAILEMAAETEVAGSTPKVGRDSYIRRLDGLVFGNDPREGFFRQNVFYHPEMAFQITFPQGWQTANLKTAVQGQSPEQDAFLVLTLAEAEDPGSALQAFSQQAGIQSLRTDRSAINGVPAVSMDFTYRGEDQEGRGQVAFLDHGGSVLQVLAFATPSTWQASGGTLASSVRSFRPVSDPEILNVAPQRLRIVSLSRSTSLDDVLRREGAEGQAEAVRLLNGLEGNPTLEAGRLLKIPEGGRLPGGQ
jgi:predicted Zn-dependent protease